MVELQKGMDETNIRSALKVFNLIPDCIAWKDSSLRYTMMNDHTAKLCGYSSSEVSFDGVCDADLPCPASEMSEIFNLEDKLVLRTRKTITTVNFCVYGDNNWRIILGRKSPLFDSNNELMGVYVRGTDVTDCGLMSTMFSVFLDDKKQNLNGCSQGQSSYILKDTHDDFGLSERESECLFFLIRSKTAKEIGQILNISPRTVEKHIDRIKIRLDCSNKSQIVEKAIVAGLGSVIPKSTLKKLR